jgi:AraC-like DNA-binding protein
MRVSGSARLWREVHEGVDVCLITGGRGNRSRYRRWTFDHTPGTASFFEPGEAHADVGTYGPCDFAVLFLAPAVFEEAARELELRGGRPHLALVATRDDDTVRALDRLQRVVAADPADVATWDRGALARDTLLAEFVRGVLERYAERYAERGAGRGGAAAGARLTDAAAVRRAREFLHAHWNAPVRLAALAAACERSRYHLVRTFRDHTGLPPHTYQRHLRLARARRLLAAGRPVSGVALETGFADQSHFTLHFRRLYGVTPAAYARQVGAR